MYDHRDFSWKRQLPFSSEPGHHTETIRDNEIAQEPSASSPGSLTLVRTMIGSGSKTNGGRTIRRNRR